MQHEKETKETKLKVNHTVMAQTLVLLKAGPVTAQTIATKTGVHIVTAQAWLRALWKQGAVHIGSWLPDSRGRDATPVYELGSDVDEPRRKLSRAEISRRYRQRQQQKEID